MNTAVTKSFIVQILEEQNHTWQGTIKRLDNNTTQGFRSVLELVKIIDGVLEESRRDDISAYDRVIFREIAK